MIVALLTDKWCVLLLILNPIIFILPTKSLKNTVHLSKICVWVPRLRTRSSSLWCAIMHPLKSNLFSVQITAYSITFLIFSTCMSFLSSSCEFTKKNLSSLLTAHHRLIMVTHGTPCGCVHYRAALRCIYTSEAGVVPRENSLCIRHGNFPVWSAVWWVRESVLKWTHI